MGRGGFDVGGHTGPWDRLFSGFPGPGHSPHPCLPDLARTRLDRRRDPGVGDLWPRSPLPERASHLDYCHSGRAAVLIPGGWLTAASDRGVGPNLQFIRMDVDLPRDESPREPDSCPGPGYLLIVFWQWEKNS